MSVEEPDPTTRAELRERLARVEEKQDHIAENQERVADKIDDVADTLDEDLGELEDSHETVATRTRKMWLGVQFMKYVGGPGGAIAAAAVFFF